jgi:hypothetical protein
MTTIMVKNIIIKIGNMILECLIYDFLSYSCELVFIVVHISVFPQLVILLTILTT